MAMILFGINLTPLYNAIAFVESSRGARSPNVYQIRDIYVDDVSRIYPLAKYNHKDVFNKEKSEMMMLLYWRHYAYEYTRKTGMPITHEVLARIHNGGPNGMLKESTIPYWEKVREQLEKDGVL